jgi:hypothetical protein
MSFSEVVTKFSGRMDRGTGSWIDGRYFWVSFTRQGRKWPRVPGSGSTFSGRRFMWLRDLHLSQATQLDIPVIEPY